MATVTVTAATNGQTITHTYFNNTINPILNEVNGNLDENNYRDGTVSAAKLAVSAVDLSTNKVTGNLPVANLNSGTNASSETFWRGDATWAGLAQPARGAFSNLKVTRASASTVTVTADDLVVQTSGGSAVRISSVSETADITASGANGLDTGSEAGNTIYYVFIIRKSSDGTTDSLLSTSATSPTLASGYDQFALVSVVGNDNSSNFIDFIQEGLEYTFTSSISMTSGNVGAASWVSIDLTPATLSFFVASSISTIVKGVVAGQDIFAVTNDSAVAASSTIAPNKIGVGGLTPTGMIPFKLPILTADTIYWISNNAAGAIYIDGFILNKLG